MNRKQLAAALGISGAMVTKLSKRGMPTDDVEQALRWRRRYLEPARMKGFRIDTAPGPPAQTPASPATVAGDARKRAIEAALDQLNAEQFDWQAGHVELRVATRLGELSLADFARYSRVLRAFMRCVPASDRPRLELHFELWDRLMGAEFMAALDAEQERHPLVESEQPFGSDLDDAQGLGVIYSVACGELTLMPERAS